MNRAFVAVLAASTMLLSVGCASKKYVRNEVTPVINKTNELDEMTRNNTNAIRDVDARAQLGIKDVNQRAQAADQKAASARQTADEAQNLANQASGRANSLATQVANLDNYHSVVETSVHFGFDKADLTPKARKALDELGAELPNARHYIIVVEGGTDSVGDPQYNYQLSERRASAVIQYLASKYSVPAHKIYVIGLGKDKEVASNSTSAGRARNRRVDVRLMTNSTDSSPAQASNAPAASAAISPQR
ncbi:MAG TPA: OmpA family protein [Terriglobales bacterium]|nr:OmpA family protein [Terriglobales bacterium]